MEAVERILGDLELGHTPRMVVYNKADLLSAEERDVLDAQEGSIILSAQDPATTAPLLKAIETSLWRAGANL
mgnify:CR=1 FL=1